LHRLHNVITCCFHLISTANWCAHIQFLDVIVNADDIPDEHKARICKKLGEADKVCLMFICYVALDSQPEL
jgi:hypothetical protein